MAVAYSAIVRSLENFREHHGAWIDLLISCLPRLLFWVLPFLSTWAIGADWNLAKPLLPAPFGAAAHSLGIADCRQRPVFWFRKSSLHCSTQQAQFAAKNLGAFVRQRLNQAFQHCPQAASY